MIPQMGSNVDAASISTIYVPYHTKQRQRYSINTLEHAAELVRADKSSLRQASIKYGIPKSTLQNTVHKKFSGHKVGANTILTEEEENRIADWVIHLTRVGYGLTRQQLANTVKKIIDTDDRPNRFRDNRPGKAWLASFFCRHPDISLPTVSQLRKERASISLASIAQWFKEFVAYVGNEIGDSDLLNDPTRIYTADGIGFSLCRKGSKVIGIQGAPDIYHYVKSDKIQLTVMAACSASAHFMPPMLIFPGQDLSSNLLEGFEEAELGQSANGRMNSEVFCNWLENVFVPGIIDREVKKPVLLLIDGRVIHLTMKTSDICHKHGIELYCLLEHESPVLQPFDLSLFPALKKNWRQAVTDWQSEHVGDYVTKETFARVFKEAWTNSTTVDIAVNGFKEAGLFPVDENTVINSVKIESRNHYSQISRSKSTNTTHSSNSETVMLSYNDEQPSIDEILIPAAETVIESLVLGSEDGN